MAQTFGVSVTPQGGSTPNRLIQTGGYTQSFRVQNEGTAQDTWTLTCVGASSVISASCQSSITLAGNSFQNVTVTYSTGNEGTGVLYLTASSSNSSDQGFINVPVVLPAGAPRMTVLYLDGKQDLGRCAMSCFAATYEQSTVPYFVLDAPRNVTLVYQGDRVAPKPFVAMDVFPDTTFGSWPSEYQLQVKVNGVARTFLNGETTLRFQGTSGSTKYRMAGQFTPPADANGTVDTLEVVLTAVFSGSSLANRWIVPYLHVDAATSAIARGWTLAGVQRAFITTGNGVLVTEGDGSATYFRWNPVTHIYDAPTGDFSRLDSVSTSPITWVRSYPDSTKVTFTSAGLMAKVTDRWGVRRDSVVYDGSQRVTQVWDALNNVITLAYGTNGLSTITDPMGRVTTVTAQANKTLTAIQDPDLKSTTFGYDASLRLQTITDRNSKTTTLGYLVKNSIETNKVASITAPAIPKFGGGTQAPVTTLSPWQTNGVPYVATGVTAFVSPRTDTTYARVTEPGSAVTKFTVNKWGTPAVTTDALGRVTTVTFTAFGQPTTIAQPGYPATQADTLQYNGSGLVTYRKLVGSTGTTIVYGDWAQPTDVSGTGQPTIHYTLGSNGRVSAVTVGGITTQQFTYDGYGRIATATDGTGNVTTNVYFTTGTHRNLNTVTLPGSRTTTYGYDGKGRQITVSPPVGAPLQTAFYNDSTNVVDSVKVATSSPTLIKYKYDKLGRDTTVTDPKGQVYKTFFNDLGWVIKQVDPAGARDTFQYSVDGDLRRHTNRRNQNIDLGYDVLHRPTSQTGSNSLTWSYPTDTSVVAVSPAATDTAWTSRDNLATTVTAKTVLNSNQAYVRAHYFSGGGQLDSVRVSGPAGTSFTPRDYVYNASQGKLTDIKLNSLASSLTTDANGCLTFLTLPGGSQANITCGSPGPVKNLAEAANNDYLERWLGINAMGQLDRSLKWNTRTGRWFDYDSLGQLRKGKNMQRDLAATVPPGCPTNDYGMSGNCTPTGDWFPMDSLVYAYDAAGNRTDQGGTYTTGNRMSAFGNCTYTTDADGNVTGRSGGSCAGAAAFFWTAEGQLDSIQVTATGTGIKYRYDALGRLVQKRVNGTSSSYFLWDDDNPLAELNGTATSVSAEYSYYPGLDTPHALIKSGTRYYARADGFGNVQALADEAQVLKATYEYDDWGHMTTSSDGASFNGVDRARWKGALWMGPEVEVYYMRNRWYEPATGRFLSEDPMGLAGGVNPSVFAGNEPVKGLDPTGLDSDLLDNLVCTFLPAFNALHCDSGVQQLPEIEVFGTMGKTLGDWLNGITYPGTATSFSPSGGPKGDPSTKPKQPPQACQMTAAAAMASISKGRFTARLDPGRAGGLPEHIQVTEMVRGQEVRLPGIIFADGRVLRHAGKDPAIPIGFLRFLQEAGWIKGALKIGGTTLAVISGLFLVDALDDPRMVAVGCNP